MLILAGLIATATMEGPMALPKRGSIVPRSFLIEALGRA